MESKKLYSWWWDSHISPKNCKWLQENLEQMDQNVKMMLKLIEEDGDSFARRAEMYYRKRPDLCMLVEELYHMHRSLAERYDHVTGELRKNIPSEFFLGTGRSSSDLGKDGDESSTLDSVSESDDSSINNYSSTLMSNDDDQGMRKKISELEVELRNVKEKLRVQREEISENSYRGSHIGNNDNLIAKIAGYEEDLRNAKEKIRLSEEEISKLRIELQKYESGDYVKNVHELSAGQKGKISDEELQENSRVKELEREVETQKEIVLEGAEQKGEAIRQAFEHKRL